MRRNVASQKIGAQLVSKTDGSNVTSGTTDVYVTIDGGTQATTGAATHEGNGAWTYAPSQAETNGDHILFTFVNSSAVSASVNVYTRNYVPNVVHVPWTTDATTSGTALKAACDAAATAADGRIVQMSAGLYTLGGSDNLNVNGYTLRGVGEATRINGGTTTSGAPVVSLYGTGTVAEDFFLDFTGLIALATFNYPIGRWTSNPALVSATIRRVKVRAFSDGLYYTQGTGTTADLFIDNCDIETGVDAGVVTATGTAVIRLRVRDTRFVTFEADPEEPRFGVKFSGAGIEALLERTTISDFDDTGATLLSNAGGKIYLVRTSFHSLHASSVHIENSGTIIVNDCDYDAAKTQGAGTLTVVPTHGPYIRTTSFAAGAIDAAAIATDAIGSNEVAAGAVTKIQAGLSTLTAAGVRTAIGMAAADLDTQLDAIGSSLGTGTGPYAINHSGGTGAGSVAATLDLAGGTTFAAWATDALRYTSDGSTGVPSLTIRAYVKASYDTTTGAGFAGSTTTKADGRWAAPLNLASGDYYVIGDNGGDGYQATQASIRIP